MQAVLDDTLITAMLTLPIQQGWATVEGITTRARLRATDIGADIAALLPAGEATALAASHVIVPEVAVVCDAAGAIAMRTPVRPDAIEESIVCLYDVSLTAELLLRAILRPFFGITASGFASAEADDNAADAQVVLIEGIPALQSPEAGFQEDLCRAWFILTGLRLVSHVLVVPVESQEGDVTALASELRRLIATGIERRRDVRVALATDNDLDRGRLVEVTSRLRWSLERADIDSLQMLTARGTWGMNIPRTLPAVRAVESDSIR